MKDTKVKSDQKQNSATMLMTEGKIWKQLLVFAVPLILGNLLQQMYNAVDSIIVGNYVGSNALAAVGGPIDQPVKTLLHRFGAAECHLGTEPP